MREAPWPSDAEAEWPPGCLIEGVAVHPREPWLAAACTDADNERGAVIVFDAEAGTIRSTTMFEGCVGWSTPELLSWHPDGVRLATNVDTNGIALLERAEVVGRAYPDDTRDGGVRYVWVGDQMFTDTGALFEIQPGDHRFEFEDIGAPNFEEIRWNAAAGAVVGRVGMGIAAFDPLRRQLLYHEALDHLPSARTLWSPDGRWCARLHTTASPAAGEVLVFDTADGRLAWTLRPSSPELDRLYWAPSKDALALQAHVYERGSRHGRRRCLDLVRKGETVASLSLGPRQIQASFALPETSGVAWSPSTDGIALQLVDARSGMILTSFHAPAIPAGLPDYYTGGYRPEFGFPGDLMWPSPHRLVRIAALRVDLVDRRPADRRARRA